MKHKKKHVRLALGGRTRPNPPYGFIENSFMKLSLTILVLSLYDEFT